MRVKQSLENRIRGWFPHEPYLISRTCTLEYPATRPPPMIRPDYTLGATKFTGVLAIFWIIFYSFIFFSSLNFEGYTVSLFQLIVWIILGVIIGIGSCIMYTKREFCRLSRNYQIDVNWKDLILITLLPALVFFFTVLFVRPLIGLPFAALNFSLYAWGACFVLTRYNLLHSYEKTENMRIMTSWIGGGFAVIPKPQKQDAPKT